MMSIEFSSRYKKSYKLAKKRGLDITLLNNVVRQLAEGIPLDPKHKDHQLSGNYKLFASATFNLIGSWCTAS